MLKVDGHSLIGIDQENAAKLMTNTGPVVTLEVAKQGAVFHGLSGLLKEGASAANSGQLPSAASTSSLLLKQGNSITLIKLRSSLACFLNLKFKFALFQQQQ